MIDLGINLSDETVSFIPCPGNSPCCSFSATESHLFFGHIRGEISVCCMDYQSLSIQVVASEKLLQPTSSSLEHSEKISNDSRDSFMVDCICVCPYTSMEETFLSVLHGHHTLTFVKFNSSDNKDKKENSLNIYRSVELRLNDELFQYTNRATAHCWLDNDTFLVGCLDGTVLAVSATVETSPHVLLREYSPIVQISCNSINNVFAISSVSRSVVATYNDGSLNISPIGSKPREEGMFGACIWPLNCTVYAARHNARIFEYDITSSVVSRTYRIPKDAELGIIRPLLMLSMPSLSSSSSLLRKTSLYTNDNIGNGENGERFPLPIFLWSEGPNFISVLVLTSEDVCHVTRRFTDFAIVSTVILSSWVLVLCSNGYLMCVPLGSNVRQSQQCSDDTPTNTLGDPSIEPVDILKAVHSNNNNNNNNSLVTSSSSFKPSTMIRRKRIVKKKVLLVTRRKKVVNDEVPQQTSTENSNTSINVRFDEPSFSSTLDSTDNDDDNNNNNNRPSDDKGDASPFPPFPHGEASSTNVILSEVTTMGATANENESLRSEDDKQERIELAMENQTTSLSLEEEKEEKEENVREEEEEEDDVSLRENSATGSNIGSVEKESDVVEKTLKDNYHRFRVGVNHLIRLFNVHALRIGEHSQLYANVLEFLPFLEEQMLEGGLLLWPFHVVLHFSKIGSSCTHFHLTSGRAKETIGRFFTEEEVIVNALRNVLKFALAWSLNANTKDNENSSMKTLHILHLLLAIPWPISSVTEKDSKVKLSLTESEEFDFQRVAGEHWVEEADIIEKLVQRSGAYGNYLALVIALSNYIVFSPQIIQPSGVTSLRLSALVNGYEKSAVELAHLQATRCASIGCKRPLNIEFQIEELIIKQSPNILEVFEVTSYPYCVFFAYFPYIFATFPSKAIILALQHYPGTSFSYFEWALSSNVQGTAYQILRGVGSELTRLSLEDLADGLADLALTLYETANSSLCNSLPDYLTCLRILLQRHFTLMQWTMEAERERFETTMEEGYCNSKRDRQSHLQMGKKRVGSMSVAMPLIRRKLERLEDVTLDLLQHVQSVMNDLTIKGSGTEKKLQLQQDILELLEEYEFPEGILTLSWTREFISRCISKGRVELLMPLFQLPQGGRENDWIFLFHQSHRDGTLEVAMLFCLTVEKIPSRVEQLLRKAFPTRTGSLEAACGDEQIERVVKKLSMLS